MSDEPTSTRPLQRLATHVRSVLRDRDGETDLAPLAHGSCFADVDALIGRSVVIATKTQAAGGAAMVALDGIARRIVVTPPDLKPAHLDNVIEDAEVEVIATDDVARFSGHALPVVPILRPHDRFARPTPGCDTEWVLLTSGTSGRPKMVAHTLQALTGAIVGPPPGGGSPVWATFYDIRRYGGLQIFLRAVLGRTDLVLSGHDEPIADHLRRLAAAGATAVSGTPSHWRRVLMSQQRGEIAPRYIRLSGEIADQFVLDGLRAAYPDAAIGHAYASTEAGVGFAVEDELEGFPVSIVDQPSDAISMKVADGSLRIRSIRAATRYVGPDAPELKDAEGFVDTGDLVERRGERFYFVGRRGGIINVGGLKVNPEEVEAALNSHHAVRMSLVQARKNPLTGAIVTADVVLRETADDPDSVRSEILELCQGRLDRHKVPAMIRFVPSIALTPGGKVSRANG